jgi:hypothetical protein
VLLSPRLHAAPLIALLLAVGPLAAPSLQGSDATAAAEPAEERRPAPAEPVREADTPHDPQSREEDPPETPGTTVAPVRPQQVPAHQVPTLVRPHGVRARTVDVAGRGVIELGTPAAPRGRWKGFPISLSLRDAPLPEVLRSFARLAGFNLVLDPRVQGLVTVELRDVPWDQALHVILKTHGMGAEVDGRVWLVEPR